MKALSDDFPKTIRFLWLQGWKDAPTLVKQCVASRRRLNPDWKVMLLEERNLDDFVDIESVLSRNKDVVTKQARSDVIRINLLARHGGVWVDATCICQKPLDSWLGDYMDYGFFAFCEPHPSRPIASWFLAADKGNTIVAEYCSSVNEYWRANRFRNQRNFIGKVVDRYVVKLLRNGNYRSALFRTIFRLTTRLQVFPYFWFHYLLADLIPRDGSVRKLWAQVSKLSANGPHELKRFGLLNEITPDLIQSIADSQTPLYKLDWRSGEKVRSSSSVLTYILGVVSSPESECMLDKATSKSGT